MLKTNKDLAYINKLYQENEIKCVIDGPYPFDKLPWAVQRFGDGLHNGKIVISKIGSESVRNGIGGLIGFYFATF